MKSAVAIGNGTWSNEPSVRRTKCQFNLRTLSQPSLGHLAAVAEVVLSLNTGQETTHNGNGLGI